MKIVIDIDIEEIVRQEVRAYIRENIEINNVSTYAREETVSPDKRNIIPAVPFATDQDTNRSKDFDYEYAARPGRRRSKAEIAMHEEERRVQRNLTPEEKGSITARIEINEEKEIKAKEEAKKQAHYREIEEEVTKSITEDAPDEEADKVVPEVTQNKDVLEMLDITSPAIIANDPEDGIPKTDDLSNISSLFGG